MTTIDPLIKRLKDLHKEIAVEVVDKLLEAQRANQITVTTNEEARQLLIKFSDELMVRLALVGESAGLAYDRTSAAGETISQASDEASNLATMASLIGAIRRIDYIQLADVLEAANTAALSPALVELSNRENGLAIIEQINETSAKLLAGRK
jgi:hypothetical protein